MASVDTVANNSTDQLILRGRTAARLAAIQSIYQIDIEPIEPSLVINQFVSNRFDQVIDGVGYAEPDLELFRNLVIGTCNSQKTLDPHIENVLQQGWRLNRIEAVIRALLRVATYELSVDALTPNAIIINEYVQIAKLFNAVGEVSFVNACLDKLSKKLRPSI